MLTIDTDPWHPLHPRTAHLESKPTQNPRVSPRGHLGRLELSLDLDFQLPGTSQGYQRVLPCIWDPFRDVAAGDSPGFWGSGGRRRRTWGFSWEVPG